MGKKELADALKYSKIPYETVNLDGDWQLIVSKHGGHIYGPFSSDCQEGIFWMPEAVNNPEEFKNLVDLEIWNTGGDRVWIAPEIQFNIMDRSRFRETLKTPKMIDPGNFSLEAGNQMVFLKQSLELESHNTVTGKIDIEFNRIVRNAPNPLRELKNFDTIMGDAVYCGFEQILDLKCDGDKGIYAEAWDLLQIRPKGILYIPMYCAEKGTDHYESAGNHEYCVESGVCLKITGDTRYKVAYKSANTTGRFGYIADSETDETYLIIKNYPNNPSCMYSEEPPLAEGDRGYSIHIYNDDGNSGGFAEMECNMQTIGEPTGLSHAVDRLTTWLFVGKKKSLGRISEYLLGYNMAKQN